MKNGYSEIQSTPAETASLTYSSENDNNINRDETTSLLRILRWLRCHWQMAAGILVTGLVLMGLVQHHQERVEAAAAAAATAAAMKQQEIEIEPDRDVNNADSTVLMYRPFCEYYSPPGEGAETKIVSLLQTSMQEPSRQWSPQACLAGSSLSSSSLSEQSQQANKNTTSNSVVVQLNAYGAPDAILRVNFSALAFAEKATPILGFGGAFTEASALNYNRLTQTGKDAVMELLFGASGLGYSLGRVPINSCDFSTASYDFDGHDDDFELKHFDVGVTHDAASGMIDMALRAESVFRQGWAASDSTTTTTLPTNEDTTPDGVFKLLASPWSPPPWMKKPTWEDADDAVHAAKMTYSAQPNCLREGVGLTSRYAQAWALYFSKFLTAYANLGLPLWAVTVQNEPEFPAPWEACSYTPATQKDFVSNHLGPRLRQDHPNVKLFIFDHNKDHMNVWGEMILNASSAAVEFVDGTGYHWYAGGMDRLMDGALGTPNMHRYQEKLEKFGIKNSHILLGTEACHCPTTGYSGGNIDVYWSRAERYAHTILADLAAGSNGWIEWNLILDGIGGPNHLGNICESTILAVPHRANGAGSDIPALPPFEHIRPMGNVSVGDGRTLEELNALGFPAKFLEVGVAVQPIYYYMGHISRHVRPGSVAVMGLVNQAHGENRIFFPNGQVVPGGGMNDLARDGIELTVWPCEGSTRQQFTWNEHTKEIQVFGHDWLGTPTTFCVGRRIDKDLMGVRLTACDKSAGIFNPVPIDNAENHYKLALDSTQVCLVIAELKNNGGAYGPRGGAQVSIGSCEDQSARWKVNRTTGEIMSVHFADENGANEVCMTTGWPFLQMGAFLTPNGQSEKTVIILNEARDSANYALQDEHGVVLIGTIAPRSIQTVLLD